MGPFATATEFCEWTGMAIPPDLSRLQTLLSSASALIRGITGQTLSKVTADQITLEPTYGYWLFLPEAPVIAIDGIIVDAVPITTYTFTMAGKITRTDGKWMDNVTVTYTHGYEETSQEFLQIKMVCIEAASRAYTLNERSASEAMGSTLMETAGYAPEVFLTQGEMQSLPGTLAAVG